MNAWHLDDDLIRRYQDGGTDLPLAGSVEAHLLSCCACRRVVDRAVPAERLAGIWRNIEAEMDAPQPTMVQRLLARLGLAGLIPAMTHARESLRRRPFWGAASAMACALLCLVLSGSVQAPSIAGGTVSPPTGNWIFGPRLSVFPPMAAAEPAAPHPEPTELVDRLLTVKDLQWEARIWVSWVRSPDVATTTGNRLEPCQLAAVDRMAATPIVTTLAMFQTDTAGTIPSVFTVFANPNGPDRLDVYVVTADCPDGKSDLLAVREDFPYLAGAGDAAEAIR